IRLQATDGDVSVPAGDNRVVQLFAGRKIKSHAVIFRVRTVGDDAPGQNLGEKAVINAHKKLRCSGMIFFYRKSSVVYRVLKWVFLAASGNIIGKIAGIVL